MIDEVITKGMFNWWLMRVVAIVVWWRERFVSVKLACSVRSRY